jgi:hypothetical protein
MEAKWPEREAGPLHPPSAEVKQAYVWIYSFISSMHLHGMVLNSDNIKCGGKDSVTCSTDVCFAEHQTIKPRKFYLF